MIGTHFIKGDVNVLFRKGEHSPLPGGIVFKVLSEWSDISRRVGILLAGSGEKMELQLVIE